MIAAMTGRRLSTERGENAFADETAQTVMREALVGVQQRAVPVPQRAIRDGRDVEQGEANAL